MAAFDRVLDVIEYVTARGPTRVSDFCDDLKIPRSTAHRLLTMLEQRGYVVHDTSAHVYLPGQAITRLASLSASSLLVKCAEPALVKLREETRETVTLGVVQGGRIVYAATLDGALMPRMSVTVGQDVPPHAAAIGKAILSALPDGERTRFLGREPYPRYTQRTITARSCLEAELSSIADHGYAIDNEEVDAGAVCVASVVRDGRAVPIGSISVSGATARSQPDTWPALGKMVRSWCDHVSSVFASQPTGTWTGNGR